MDKRLGKFSGGVYRHGGMLIAVPSVALARAVYARTKFVLLDDPLSAVVCPLLLSFDGSLIASWYVGQPYREVLVRQTLARASPSQPHGSKFQSFRTQTCLDLSARSLLLIISNSFSLEPTTWCECLTDGLIPKEQ